MSGHIPPSRIWISRRATGWKPVNWLVRISPFTGSHLSRSPVGSCRVIGGYGDGVDGAPVDDA
jgi:hypothetical protein